MALTFEALDISVMYTEDDPDSLNLKGHITTTELDSEITGVMSNLRYNTDADVIDAYPSLGFFPCNNCGERLNLELDRTDRDDPKLHVINECPVPQGFAYDVTIDVPSGELIIVDSFGVNPDKDKNGRYVSINSLVGQETFAGLLEEQNIAYAQLTNGGFHIYENLITNEIHVGGLYDYETDEVVIPPDHTELGFLICDVWGVQITDADTYTTMKPYRNPENLIRVKVKPGKYTLTNYTTLVGHSMSADEPVHATLLRTGDL